MLRLILTLVAFDLDNSFRKKYNSKYIGVLSGDKCKLSIPLSSDDRNDLPLVQGEPFKSIANAILLQQAKSHIVNMENAVQILQSRILREDSIEKKVSNSLPNIQVIYDEEHPKILENNIEIVKVIGNFTILQEHLDQLTKYLGNGNPEDSYLSDIIVNIGIKFAIDEIVGDRQISTFSPDEFLSFENRNRTLTGRKIAKFRQTFGQGIVLWPICSENHWFLAEFDYEHKIVKLFESAGMEKSMVLTSLEAFVKILFPKENWKANKEKCAKQSNPIDCGMFAIAYAKMICRGQNEIDPQDVEEGEARRRLQKQILRHP